MPASLALGLAAAAAIAAATVEPTRPVQAAPTVEARLRGNAVEVAMSAAVAAPSSVVWATITDYERQVDWIPGLVDSRVVFRDAGKVRLEQAGTLRWLVFRFTIRARVEVEERPPSQVDVRLLEGDLRRLEGSYRIEPGTGPGTPTVLRWTGTIEPRAPLPGLLTRAVVGAALREQFQGVLDEIARRAASGPTR